MGHKGNGIWAAAKEKIDANACFVHKTAMPELPDFHSHEQVNAFLYALLERAQGNNLRLLLINCFGETEGEASFRKYNDKVIIPLWEMADCSKKLHDEMTGSISAVDHTKFMEQLRDKDAGYAARLFSRPHMEAIMAALWDFDMTLESLHNELENEGTFPQLRHDMEMNMAAMSEVRDSLKRVANQLDMAQNPDKPVGQMAATFAKLHAQANRPARGK